MAAPADADLWHPPFRQQLNMEPESGSGLAFATAIDARSIHHLQHPRSDSPVARMLDADPTCAEVTRCASDGTPHAASMCLAAARRAALALGYRRLVSYTLLGEAGTSYLAAGWVVTGLVDASQGWHSRAGRTTIQGGGKVRWETGPNALATDGAAALVAGMCAGRVDVTPRAEVLPLLRGLS